MHLAAIVFSILGELATCIYENHSLIELIVYMWLMACVHVAYGLCTCGLWLVYMWLMACKSESISHSL